MKRAKQKKTDELLIPKMHGHKNLRDPSDKLRETMEGRIYGQGKFFSMEWNIDGVMHSRRLKYHLGL